MSGCCVLMQRLMNGAMAMTNGILPAWARPAATPIRFCSLMPRSKWRSGKRAVKEPIGPKSCDSSTRSGFCPANSARTSADENAAK